MSRKRTSRSIEEREPPLRFEAIEQLRAPSQNILRSINDRVRDASYKLLIGDDASGRIPALILWRVLRGLHARMRAPGPACVFLRGHVNAPRERVEMFRGRLSELIDDYKETGAFPVAGCRLPEPLSFDGSTPEILVVTDAVQLGRSLKPLADTLKDHSAGFEIATVQKTSEYPGNPYGVPIHSGRLLGQRLIYQNYDLIGVQKGSPLLTAERWPRAQQPTINAAREDVRRLSEQLVRWYLEHVDGLV